MKKIIVSVFIIFITQLGFSCSCSESLLDLPIKEMGWTQSKSTGISSLNNIIFTGKLISIIPIEEESLISFHKKSISHKNELVFKIIKSYKGNSPDTISIRTNRGSDACGFDAKINTDCLIFANQKDNGCYYTYRSDCCKSIAKEKDEKRYNKYITFLESILNMKDGVYNFKQSRGYWDGGSQNLRDTLDLINFKIKNGKFEGEWKITDRKGRVLEIGNYKNGNKIGLWKIVSIYPSNYDGTSTETELIRYKNNQPIHADMIIEDQKFNFEKGKYEIIRIQKISKDYEYH